MSIAIQKFKLLRSASSWYLESDIFVDNLHLFLELFKKGKVFGIIGLMVNQIRIITLTRTTMCLTLKFDPLVLTP